LTCIIREWLPRAAFADARIGMALAAAVDDWRRRWFARAPHDTTGTALRAASAGGSADSDMRWVSVGGPIVFRVRSATVMALARAAADAPKGIPRPAAADTRLLTGFGETILANLATALGVVLGLAVDERAAMSDAAVPVHGDGVDFEIVAQGPETALRISIPGHAAAPFRKRLIGSPKRPVPALIELSALAGDARLGFSATLGAAHISLEEARALAVGDVLLLETALADCIAVRSLKSDGGFAQAHVVPTEAGIQLILQGTTGAQV
jgi:hypothetical protein